MAHRTVLVHIGRRWALVTDYANHSGGIGRHGWWCEDAAGGWGTSRRSAEEAVAQCARPVLYPTKQAALDTICTEKEQSWGIIYLTPLTF